MNHPQKKERRGLKKFSSMILSILQKEKQMDYTRVAEVVIAMSGGAGEDKNIRRRIYDALNVMCAIDLIKKEKKMVYLLEDTNCTCSTEKFGTESSAEHHSAERIRERIEEKRALLKETSTRKELLLKLLEKNRERGAIDEKDKLHFPFLLIGTEKKSLIDCETNDKQTYFKFTFEDEYKIYEDVHVLKQMFGKDKDAVRGIEHASPEHVRELGGLLQESPVKSSSVRGVPERMKENAENVSLYAERCGNTSPGITKWLGEAEEEYKHSSIGSSYLFTEDEDWLNLYNFLN